MAEAEDGQMMHGRNLDYGFVDYLQNITYVAHFYRNNTVRSLTPSNNVTKSIKVLILVLLCFVCFSFCTRVLR